MNAEQLASVLSILDLTDPANGTHAINLVLQKIVDQLSVRPDWPLPEIRRQSPVVPIRDNYDRLFIGPENVSRLPRYTRYVSDTHLLRTQTTSIIPNLLLERNVPEDRLLICPGICYRRDIADKTHCGEPHQVDIWRIRKGEPYLRRDALLQLIEIVIHGLMPGVKYRCNEVTHPYTLRGLEVEVHMDGKWLEVLECGEAHPQLLEDAGLDARLYSGLAMGIGLDRMVMRLKGVDDIRLLRSKDKRIREQMMTLAPYHAVSRMPPIRNDLSIATDGETNIEDITEAVREALGKDAEVVEEIVVLSETPWTQLPAAAIERIGMKSGQKNVLLRIVFRSYERTLTQPEANRLRNLVYRRIHKGDKLMLADDG